MRKRRKVGWGRHKYLFINSLSFFIVLDVFFGYTDFKEIFSDNFHKILLIASFDVVGDIPILA